MLCNADDMNTPYLENAPDPPAWAIHGAIHRLIPRARVILHCHPPYATTIASLKDPTLYPIEQNIGRFFNRVSYYMDYDGLVDNSNEGEKISRAFGDNDVMMMANHGVTVIGQNPDEALNKLFYLERGCRILHLAYASNQPLRILSDKQAESTAKSWERYDMTAFQVWFE
jgi:ribulose-5-phosphate 4-epimerase/fuculose-1-phosphate aldolase